MKYLFYAKQILVFFLLCFGYVATATALHYVWGAAVGSTLKEECREVTVDASDNVYTAGYFAKTVDFDPDAGTANRTSAGETDIFINKLDCTQPTFTTCPSAHVTANTATGLCSAVVTYDVAASGTPEPVLTYTFSGATNGTGSGTGSNQTFNKGNTIVTVTATNDCGTSSCSFTVTVSDNEAPTVTCPPDITVNNIIGLCNAPVTIFSQNATDNCSSFLLGTGLNFDGVDDVAKVAASSPINTQTLEKRTAEVYFRVNDKNISSRKQVIWEEGGTNNGLNIYIFNGRLYFGIYSLSQSWSGVWVSTNNIQSGQWHNAVLVYDGTITTQRLKAYLDGVLVASADASANLGARLANHPQSNAVGALDFRPVP